MQFSKFFHHKSPASALILGAIIILAVIGFFVIIVGIGLMSELTGNNSGGPQTSNSGQIDCSGVAKLTPENYQYVKDAASKYLKGDEAALVSLIQIESGWSVIAHNDSSASGLGQFVDSTAKGWPEFVGGDDKHGIVWPAGTIYDNPKPAVHPDDARYDAKRSIYASAHYLGGLIKKYGGLQDAYVKGYHGGSTPNQIAAAQAAGQKLMIAYNDLIKGGGCKETRSSSTGLGCGNVPIFKQCGQSWSNGSYGSGGKDICSSGCGPTSVAMVLKFYGINVTPEDTAQLSLSSGCRVSAGTSGPCLISKAAQKYGLKSEVGIPWDKAIQYLKQGKPIIVSGRGGAPFTSVGHFIVLTCYNENGGNPTISVNDPAGGSSRDNKSYPESVIKKGQHFIGIIYK